MLNSRDSIEEMAATIAHEIKNPLSLVQSNINLLELADKENIHSKNYNVIKNELVKINDMMVDFLELTKQPTDSNDLVYIYDILNPIVSKYEVSMGEDVEILFNHDDNVEDISVIGSQQSLVRVFDNLIKNAVEATLDNDKKIIEINIFSTEKEMEASIMDNGMGIKEEDLMNIEKTFFTTKVNGSGLGLSITKKVIDELKGSFSLENKHDNKGAIATVKLPIFNK